MRNNTKIMLSARELAIVTDTDFILTKQKIIQQVMDLFQQQIPFIQQQFQSIWMRLTNSDKMPKITKGEQYRSLPYVVLDYPAVFEKNDRLALRTIFCWADAFSVTLHCCGTYKQLLINRLETSLPTLQQLPIYICINEKEWEHYFEEDNYLPLARFANTELAIQLQRLPHIKIALRYPLTQWNDIEQHLQEAYVVMRSLLNDGN